MEVEALNFICTSQRELEKAFDVSAAMSFGFGLGSLKANFQFVNSHIMTDTTLCFVIKIRMEKLAKSIEDAKISKKAESLYEKDPVQFLRTYGDHFVRGLSTGGIFYGTIFIECKEENRKNQIAAELSGKAKIPILEADAGGEFDKEITDVYKDLRSSVYVHTVGVSTPNIPVTNDVKKMLNLASLFPARTEKEGKFKVIKAMLMDYEAIGLSNSNDFFLNLKTSRQKIIDQYAELRSVVLSKLELINKIKGNPLLYPSQKPEILSQLIKDLNSALSMITAEVEKCMINPEIDMVVKDIKLPEMKMLDKIKESPIPKNLASQNAEISSKYGMYKQILGDPIKAEQSCVDGIGRFRLYKNGAIFYHPDIGTYEIHGSIFDRYESEKMESGRLGYPKTDEEALPTGVKRSIFENGAIYFYPSNGQTQIGIGKNPLRYTLQDMSSKEKMETKINFGRSGGSSFGPSTSKQPSRRAN